MISEKERQYIERAATGARRNAYAMLALTLSMVLLGDGSFLFFGISLNRLTEAISLVGLNICLLIMFLVVLEFFRPKKAFLDIEGIHIPATKELEYDVIKFRWIEYVMMNDRMDCDAYVMVLFTDDQKEKYAYHFRQGGLDDPVDFLVKLRDMGIPVEVLKPSCWWQKTVDIHRESEMIQGRKMLRSR